MDIHVSPLLQAAAPNYIQIKSFQNKKKILKNIQKWLQLRATTKHNCVVIVQFTMDICGNDWVRVFVCVCSRAYGLIAISTNGIGYAVTSYVCTIKFNSNGIGIGFAIEAKKTTWGNVTTNYVQTKRQ